MVAFQAWGHILHRLQDSQLIHPRNHEDSQRNQPSYLKIFYWYKKKVLNHYQYMTWPVPGSWENGMNFKQPTMSCQRPFGSRNRTNCRSIKTWKSLAVQTWTDRKNIESPYCSFPARVTILLRANVQSTGLFRRRHLIPKFLSNLSTASGYPKLSGDDPTNLLKHFEALY